MASGYYAGGVYYDIGANDLTGEAIDSAIAGFDKVNEKADETTVSLGKVAAAFGALTAISAGAVEASDRVVTLERNTSRAGLTLGVTTEGMYDYVRSLSSALDPQEEVGATMNYLSRSGLEWGESLTTIYESLDTLGDATGETSTQVAQELIPTFKALEIPLQDIPNYIDAIAYAANHSLMDLSDLSYYVRRFGDDFKTSGMSMEDMIAIMERMSELGIPTRIGAQELSNAFKAAQGDTKDLTTATNDYNTALEKLKDNQKDLSDLESEYQFKIGQTGRNLDEAASLTEAYTLAKKKNKEKEDELQKKADAAKADVAAAQISPMTVDTVLDALEKIDPRFKKADIKAQSQFLQSSAVAGTAEKYQNVAEIATGSEKAAYLTDQAMQTVGKNITSNQAEALVVVRDISGAVTAISGVLAIIKGFSAATAAATTATAAKSGADVGGLAGISGMGAGSLALSTIAGLGIGIAGVEAMEATGITSLGADFSGDKSKQGLIEQEGGAFMDLITGDLDNRYLAEYLKTHNGQYPPGYDPATGKKSTSTTGDVSGYAKPYVSQPATNQTKSGDLTLNFKDISLKIPSVTNINSSGNMNLTQNGVS